MDNDCWIVFVDSCKFYGVYEGKLDAWTIPLDIICNDNKFEHWIMTRMITMVGRRSIFMVHYRHHVSEISLVHLGEIRTLLWNLHGRGKFIENNDGIIEGRKPLRSRVWDWSKPTNFLEIFIDIESVTEKRTGRQKPIIIVSRCDQDPRYNREWI